MNDNDTITLTIIAAIVCLFGFMIGFNVGQDNQLNAMRETYKTCLVAHAEINGDSEQACADAQDKTSTEFLCSPQGNCWVEVK